ncbi:MAG: HgcAB-like fusion protein [Chloroflexota bacterium]|nr:HgcAB-like fusion protein [Chloroflexota bacterium]
MSDLKYIGVNIVETLLRMFPFPRQTGVIKIGNPDRQSPVFLTCNFHLTVERVKRALRGMDCYLLIANSRGINVWCAATGGLFTNHDAISALKTSGIDDLVDHRQVILPQLAAAGIETKVVQKKTGWRVVWGPVYAEDIPAFVKNEFDKTPDMRTAEFPWIQRVEAAVFWGFPISIVAAILAFFFWREAVLPLILLIWGMALVMLLSFPLYRHLIGSEGEKIGFISFERGGLQFILWGIFTLGLVAYAALVGNFTWGLALRWGLVSFVIIFILSVDLRGFTPTYKGNFLDGEPIKVTLDTSKCKGTGFCEQVCPRGCFEVDRQRRTASMPRADLCIQCGACIVQCPFDALYFESAQGGIIPPETTRRFKLNLMGKRLTKVGGDAD